MPSDTNVVGAFFYRRAPVTTVSFEIDQATFLARLSSGESINLPDACHGLRADYLRIETAGGQLLFATTLDAVVDEAHRLVPTRFFLNDR